MRACRRLLALRAARARAALAGPSHAWGITAPGRRGATMRQRPAVCACDRVAAIHSRDVRLATTRAIQ